VVSAVLAELLAVRFAGIRRSPVQLAILKALSDSPGVTQRDLIKLLDKTQTSISRAMRSLIEIELVRRKKEGRFVRYWPAPAVTLASTHL